MLLLLSFISEEKYRKIRSILKKEGIFVNMGFYMCLFKPYSHWSIQKIIQILNQWEYGFWWKHRGWVKTPCFVSSPVISVSLICHGVGEMSKFAVLTQGLYHAWFNLPPGKIKFCIDCIKKICLHHLKGNWAADFGYHFFH